jgi:hypothetical protein
MSLSLLKYQLYQKTMAEKMKSRVDAQQLEAEKAALVVVKPKRRSLKEIRHVANEACKADMLLRKTKTISKDKHKKLHVRKYKVEIKNKEINDFSSSL